MSRIPQPLMRSAPLKIAAIYLGLAVLWIAFYLFHQADILNFRRLVENY